MNMKHKKGRNKVEAHVCAEMDGIMHVDYGQVSKLSCCFQVENLNVNQATDVHKA